MILFMCNPEASLHAQLIEDCNRAAEQRELELDLLRELELEPYEEIHIEKVPLDQAPDWALR
jgi:hypothetical protein